MLSVLKYKDSELIVILMTNSGYQIDFFMIWIVIMLIKLILRCALKLCTDTNHHIATEALKLSYGSSVCVAYIMRQQRKTDRLRWPSSGARIRMQTPSRDRGRAVVTSQLLDVRYVLTTFMRRLYFFLLRSIVAPTC